TMAMKSRRLMGLIPRPRIGHQVYRSGPCIAASVTEAVGAPARCLSLCSEGDRRKSKCDPPLCATADITRAIVPVGVLFPELIPMPHTRELMRARARLAKSLTLLPAASACRHLH